MSSGAGTVGRKLDKDDLDFIETTFSGEQIVYKGWVDLRYKDKYEKDRILVITRLRMCTIKTAMRRRTVRQSFPTMHLSALGIHPGQTNRLIVDHKGDEQVIVQHHSDIPAIARALIFNYESVSYGLPDGTRPQILVPDSIMTGYFPPCPDEQDGILARYLAVCDCTGSKPVPSVLNAIMNSFATGQKYLDLGSALTASDKTSDKEVACVLDALVGSRFYSQVTVVGLPVGKETFRAAAGLLGDESTAKDYLECLSLVGTKAPKQALALLSAALTRGGHALRLLDVSGCVMGDDSTKAFATALKAGGKPLVSLAARGCGFSAKGFKHLCRTLSEGGWLANTKAVDLSDNKVGKTGTAELCGWLKQASNGVEQLYLARTEVNLALLCPALQSLKHLHTLDLSGATKLEGKALDALCALLKATSSLRVVSLSGCQLKPDACAAVLAACAANDKGAQYTLDLTGNALGQGLVKAVSSVSDAMKANNTIHTLVCADNNLQADGLAALCGILRGTNIKGLSVDVNVKTGLGTDTAEALAELLNNTPGLQELSVRGDDKKAGAKAGSLELVFAAAGAHPSLRHLDVSYNNKLDAKACDALAKAVGKSSTLESLGLHGAKLSADAYDAINQAIDSSPLRAWVISLDEVSGLLKALGANAQAKSALGGSLSSLLAHMDKNQNENASAPDVPSLSLCAWRTRYGAVAFDVYRCGERGGGLRPGQGVTKEQLSLIHHALDGLFIEHGAYGGAAAASANDFRSSMSMLSPPLGSMSMSASQSLGNSPAPGPLKSSGQQPLPSANLKDRGSPAAGGGNDDEGGDKDGSDTDSNSSEDYNDEQKDDEMELPPAMPAPTPGSKKRLPPAGPPPANVKKAVPLGSKKLGPPPGGPPSKRGPASNKRLPPPSGPPSTKTGPPSAKLPPPSRKGPPSAKLPPPSKKAPPRKARVVIHRKGPPALPKAGPPQLPKGGPPAIPSSAPPALPSSAPGSKRGPPPRQNKPPLPSGGPPPRQ